MTRDDIIELVDARTERKSKQVNLKQVYATRLVKIAKRYRFWWRKRYATWNAVPGTTLYDVSNLSTSAPTNLLPTNAFTEIAVEEITGLFRVDNGTSNPPQIGELLPIVDALGFVDMQQNVIAGRPGRYLMDYSDYKTIRLDPLDATYPLILVFWAMPAPATDSASTVVPLIPPHYHDVIVDGMRMDVFADSYGENNQKTIKALKDYEEGLVDMIMRPQFSSQIATQFISVESVVRSTPGLADVFAPMNIPLPK